MILVNNEGLIGVAVFKIGYLLGITSQYLVSIPTAPYVITEEQIRRSNLHVACLYLLLVASKHHLPTLVNDKRPLICINKMMQKQDEILIRSSDFHPVCICLIFYFCHES